jgi:hypothetical protein
MVVVDVVVADALHLGELHAQSITTAEALLHARQPDAERATNYADEHG